MVRILHYLFILSQQGYEIRDLNQNDASFIQDTSAWSATILRSTHIYSQCNQTYLLGGYTVLGPTSPSSQVPMQGQYFERVYQNLPPHNAVYFSLTFWAIDSWDYPTDSFQLRFDNKVMNGWTLSYTDFVSSLCGNPNYKELPNIRIFGSFNHNALSLDMRVISQMDQATDDESFGFRDINLLFTNSSVSDGICGRAPITVSPRQCTCTEGSYANPAGSSTCVSCDPACKSCFGSTASSCYQCADGYYYNGTQCVLCVSSCATCFGPANNQCLICKSGYFLFNNNTCLASCDLPLINTTDGVTQFCQRKCPVGEYLFDNTTCVSQCNLPLKPSSDGITDFCDRPCSSGYFLFNNITCLPSCDLPLISTTDSATQFCQRKCPIGEYLFDNTTCVSQPQCNLPLKPSSDGITDFCDRPCSSGYSLFNNNTCLPSCDLPLVPSTDSITNFCDLPCQAGKFLYKNHTCLNSCDLPLIQTSDGRVQFCDRPCPSNTFIYSNNTGICLSNCNSPLSQSILLDLNLCINPCQSGEYLYADKSCNSTCPSPLVSQVNNTIKYCMNSCPISSDYLYPDGTCQATCSSPNQIKIVNSVQTCELLYSPLSQKDVAMVKSVSSTVQAGSTALSAGVAIASVLGSNNPATFTLAAVVKMLPYIRYMEINFPPRLAYLLNNMNSSVISFSFGPSMPSYVQAKFSNYPLPGKFGEYGLNSSFLVNYWQNMTSLALILGVIVILGIMVTLVKKKKFLFLVFTKLKLIVKWNFFLMMFTTNLDGVALGTSLEMRTLSINSFAEGVSFIICLFMNVATIFVLGLIIYIIRDIRKHKHQIAPLQKIVHDQDKWEEFQIFYAGSKEDSFIRHIFLFPYLMRLYLFNLIIANLFEHPLVQAILITLLGLTMLLYMVFIRPFKSKLVLCQHTTDEIVILTVNTCILILATLDHLGSTDTHTREIVGDIIIYCNITFSMTANIYLVAYLAVGFFSAYHVIKKHKKAGFLAIITAFMAPFESGGMDMEILPSEPNAVPTLETEPDLPVSSERESVKNRIKKRLESVGSIPNLSGFSNQQPAEKKINRTKSVVLKKVFPVSNSVISSPRNTLQQLILRGSETPKNTSTISPTPFDSAQLSILRFNSVFNSPRNSSPSITERQLQSNQKLMGKISKFSNLAFRIDMPDQPRNMFENSVISEARDTVDNGNDSSRNLDLETNRAFTPFNLGLTKEEGEMTPKDNL